MRTGATQGSTLVEIVVAMGVMAVGLAGFIGLLAATHGHNESSDDVRVAYQACQEALEDLVRTPIAELPSKDGTTFLVSGIDPAQPIGSVQVKDFLPTTDPGKVFEITVRVKSAGQTFRPVDVSLVTLRASP